MNEQNLVPNSKRTPSERRENSKKAGIASGEARREKKRFCEIYAGILSAEHNVPINGELAKLSGEELVSKVIRNILIKENSSSVSIIKEMREAIDGSKLDINLNPVTIIDDVPDVFGTPKSKKSSKKNKVKNKTKKSTASSASSKKKTQVS